MSRRKRDRAQQKVAAPPAKPGTNLWLILGITGLLIVGSVWLLRSRTGKTVAISRINPPPAAAPKEPAAPATNAPVESPTEIDQAADHVNRGSELLAEGKDQQ